VTVVNLNEKPALKLTAAEKALIDVFGERFGDLPGDSETALRRDAAIETLKTAGLPTRRIESWHYTDMRRLLAAIPQEAGQAAEKLRPLVAGSSVAVIANGVATPAPMPKGVNARTLQPQLTSGALNASMVARGRDDFIGILNTAFVSDGFEIAVEPHTDTAKPIEIQNRHGGGHAHVRLLGQIGDGAKATVVERHGGDGAALVSSVTQLSVGDGVEVLWIILQDQPVSTTHLGQINITIGSAAKLTLFIMNSGGQLVRQEVNVVARGEGSDFRLRGVNLLAGNAHVDLTMVLDHVVPRCDSTEIVRNVVMDKAEGAFQGQIRVAREAQKTDARMACNTLLLSDDASFSAKPELEIFADDVACGHGATVTEIDHGHLFYLMSRGIPEREARGLLVKAFLAEIIEELEDEALVEALEARLEAWFAAHG
jgi:Fe-S cluster assembly protein SufD